MRRFDLSIHGTGEDQYNGKEIRGTQENYKRIAVLRSSNTTGPSTDPIEDDKEPGKETKDEITVDANYPYTSEEQRSSSAPLISHYNTKLLLLYYFVASKFLIHILC